MPLHYGSQLEEHRRVRASAGMFDVSHMTIVDLHGTGARHFLRHLLANDINRVVDAGGALYSCMLNEKGGVVDDLIVYWRGDDRFRLVVNAATRERDLEWIQDQSTGVDVAIVGRPELAMVAVQGPDARSAVAATMGDDVKRVRRFRSVDRNGCFLARTGYTGEDGFEIVVPEPEAPDLWQSLADAGVAPAGLGARDTLRLEAGLNLYGQDMDEAVTPLESNLAWTVAWAPEDRDFTGRAALERQREKGGYDRLRGLVLRDRGVLRPGQIVSANDVPIGAITSGGFGPTVGASVALARLRDGEFDRVGVAIRGRTLEAQVVDPPFVRKGTSVVSPT